MGEGGRKTQRRSLDSQMRYIDPADLHCAVIEVNELGCGTRALEQCIALLRNLAHAATGKNNEVGSLQPVHQLGIGADSQIACILRMQWIEQRQSAIAGDDGQLVRFCELPDVGAGLRRPPGPAKDEEWLFGCCEKGGKRLKVLR